jgi:hypothetical protein
MINVLWFTIRSSHAIINGASKAPCGRAVRGEITDERPAGKSCETCLRAVARAIGE